MDLAVGTGHRRHAAAEALAALARLVLSGPDAHRAAGSDRERCKAVLQPDEPHHRVLLAQRRRPRLQCGHRQFLVVARVLAEAFADGLVEQRRLLCRVVGTRGALRRVEDGVGQPLGELAELLLEHFHRHLVVEHAGEYLFLPAPRKTRQQFCMAELDAPLVEGTAHGRHAVQQQQPAFERVDVPAELQCRFVLVALVVGQQRCGAFGLFDVAGVVAEMVLDDAQGTRLRVGGFTDDDRHVVAVAVDVARRAPAPLAGHDLEYAIALGMPANLDRLRHAAGRLEPFLQFLHRLRIEVLPVVRPRDDVTEFQCGLHSASLWRVRQGSAQGHGPVHRCPVNPSPRKPRRGSPAPSRPVRGMLAPLNADATPSVAGGTGAGRPSDRATNDCLRCRRRATRPY